MSRYKFWRDIVTISGASVFSQIIIVITTPIFTRLYEPAALGIAAVFMAIIFTIFPVSSFSYNHAIVIAKDKDEATSVTILSFLTTLAVSISLLIPFMVFNKTIFSSLIDRDLQNFMWLIPLSVFVKGICTILLMGSIRDKSFGAQGRSKIIQTVTERILVIGAGLFGKTGALAIILGRLVSYVFEAFPFGHIATQTITYARNLTFRSIKDVAIKYRQFPLFANWTYLLANLSAYVSVFIIALFFAPEFTGLYVLSERVVHTPLIIFGDSVKNVYYQKAASQREDLKELGNFYLRLRERLLAYSIFPCLMLLFFGREIFEVVLGSKWAVAGSIAGWVALFAFFQFISSPIMGLVNVLSKQRTFLYFTGLLLGTRCFSFIVGGVYDNPMMAVWLLATSGSITYLAINGWMDRHLSINRRFIFEQLLKFSFLSLALLFSVTFVTKISSGIFLLLFALISACLIYYSVVIRIVEGKTIPVFVRDMASLVKSP